MESDKKSNGALIGSIIVIVILIIGGIYVWQSKLQKAVEQKKQAAAMQEANLKQSESEIGSLEQDLGNTSPDAGVDAEKIQ